MIENLWPQALSVNYNIQDLVKDVLKSLGHITLQGFGAEKITGANYATQWKFSILVQF